MAAPRAHKVDGKRPKKNSAFENACAELKDASDSDGKEQKEYQSIRDTTSLWPKHKNPNKGCVAASRIIKPHHCSSKIRQKLGDFIPKDCLLDYCCFSKGINCCPAFNLNAFQCIYVESLPIAFAAAVGCDQAAAHTVLKQVIGAKQFDFTVIATCNGNCQESFMKIIGETAFVKACGTSQRTDMMTFAPLFAIKLGDSGLMVLRAKSGLTGCGFNNLIEDPKRKTKRKKPIKGNAMVMIREDNIQDIEVAFYAKYGISDFGIWFESNNLTKNGYDNPVCLFRQSNTGQIIAAPNMNCTPARQNVSFGIGYSPQRYQPQTAQSYRYRPY